MRLNEQCRRFLAIGLPLALQEFLTQLSFLALCAFVNRLGLAASSGYGVASKIVSFVMLVPSALMQSMASFVAQNIGAGNVKRAKKSMFTGIAVGVAFGIVMFALVRLPLAYYMSIQPNASLTKIGMSAPVATVVGIVLNIGCFLYLNRRDAAKRGAE